MFKRKIKEELVLSNREQQLSEYKLNAQITVEKIDDLQRAAFEKFSPFYELLVKTFSTTILSLHLLRF